MTVWSYIAHINERIMQNKQPKLGINIKFFQNFLSIATFYPNTVYLQLTHRKQALWDRHSSLWHSSLGHSLLGHLCYWDVCFIGSFVHPWVIHPWDIRHWGIRPWDIRFIGTFVPGTFIRGSFFSGTFVTVTFVLFKTMRKHKQPHWHILVNSWA